MNLHLLTTPWQRALGAMFRAGLGDGKIANFITLLWVARLSWTDALCLQDIGEILQSIQYSA